jgi:hypothetical protein
LEFGATLMLRFLVRIWNRAISQKNWQGARVLRCDVFRRAVVPTINFVLLSVV